MKGSDDMKSYRPYIALAITIIVFTTLFLWSEHNEKFIVNDAISMSENWTYHGEQLTLPIQLDIDKNESYTIETVLPPEFRNTQFLLIRSSLANIEVSIDGQVIYERTYGDSLSNPYASMWHLIHINHGSEGKVVTITSSSPYQSMSGQINSIYFGSEASHYAHIYQTYGIRLIIAIVVAVSGLVMMITDLFISKKGNYRFAHIALFAILLSLWMIAESRMLQFFTGSTLLIGSLAYLILAAFPIPLLSHLHRQVVKVHKKPFIVLKIIFMIQFLVVIILYLTGLADFFQSVIFTQILIIIGVIVMFTVLLLEVRKHQNKEAMTFIKAFGVLAFFGIFELIGFAVGDFEHISIFLSTGVAVLIVILLVQYVRYVIQRMKLSHEKELYEQLAFIDYITQGKNRLAYERDLDELFKDKQKTSNLRLILFDLDNLKVINDNHGHNEGDAALKQAFDLISDVFSDFGECYRIGGDEFACLYLNPNDDVFYEKQLILSDRTKQISKEKAYAFRISYGSAVAQLCDMNMKDLIHLADLDMYSYKKKYRKIKEKGE